MNIVLKDLIFLKEYFNFFSYFYDKGVGKYNLLF